MPIRTAPSAGRWTPHVGRWLTRAALLSLVMAVLGAVTVLMVLPRVPYPGAVGDVLDGKAGIGVVATGLLGGYVLARLAGALGGGRGARKLAQDAEASYAGVGRLSFDRTLIVVTLPTDEVHGLTPTEAARWWGGILISQDAESFTVLLAQSPESARGALELLVHFDPISIQVSEPPNVIIGRPAGAETLALLESQDPPGPDQQGQDRATT